MKVQKVLVLGGAGLMAEAIERDLLEIDADEVSKITVADINSEKLAVGLRNYSVQG